MAMSAATVMKLRSRLESPGRSHTSPKSTFSLRSMSFGATPRTTSRAVGTEACVLTVCSFRGDEVMLRGALYALPTFDASRTPLLDCSAHHSCCATHRPEGPQSGAPA